MGMHRRFRRCSTAACRSCLATPEGAIQNAASGGPIRLIAGNTGKLTHSLLARAPFKSIEELKGATIGILNMIEGTFFQIREMLATHGLRFPDDYKVKETGGVPARHKALLDGGIDAGLQSIPWSYVGEDAGFNKLGDIIDYVPDWQFVSINANTELGCRQQGPRRPLPSRDLPRHRLVLRQPRGVCRDRCGRASAPIEHARRGWQHYTGSNAMTRDVSINPAGLTKVLTTLRAAKLLPPEASARPLPIRHRRLSDHCPALLERVSLRFAEETGMNRMVAQETQGRLPRVVTPNLLWTGGCLSIEYQGELAHGHFSTYLVLGSEKSMLVDTGHASHWKAAEKHVEEFLDGRPLDYVFPTHAEFPHGGLAAHWMKKYPNAICVGDVPEYPLYWPDLAPRIRQIAVGDEIDLGDRKMVFVPAIWRDLKSLWAFDTVGRVLFVSDGFSYLHYHKAGQCDFMTSEHEPPDVKLIQFFNERALRWTRYTDTRETFADIDEMLKRLDPLLIAAAHGGVIDTPSMIPLLKSGMLMGQSGAEAKITKISSPRESHRRGEVMAQTVTERNVNATASSALPASVTEICPGTIYAVGGSLPADERCGAWIPSDVRGFIPFQCYVLRDGGQFLMLDGGLAGAPERSPRRPGSADRRHPRAAFHHDPARVGHHSEPAVDRARLQISHAVLRRRPQPDRLL